MSAWVYPDHTGFCPAEAHGLGPVEVSRDDWLYVRGRRIIHCSCSDQLPAGNSPPPPSMRLSASSSDVGHYFTGLADSELASIRSLNRRKALVMASSVSSSHIHSCTGVANGSDLPGSKPKERMKPRDDCGTSAVSILRVA